MYKQKPVSIDDFNEAKEVEVKEQTEKRKAKRQELEENNKLWKQQKKKAKKTKSKKKKCGIDSFKNTEKAKKEVKKMSETVIN